MAWVRDKKCKWPKCTALVSGNDVEYCPAHEAKVTKSYEVAREVTLAFEYIKRHGKRKQRKGDGEVRPGTPIQQQALAKAQGKAVE